MLARASGQAGRPSRPIRIFLRVLAMYVAGAALLVLARCIDLLDGRGLLESVALGGIVNIAFFAAIATRFNERFADPDMSLAHTLAAIAVIMFVAYRFDHDRALVLAWCLVVLLFGVFRFKPREFLTITLFMLASYALVINLLMRYRADKVTVYLEWYEWAWLALLLPSFAVIGTRIGAMRARILRSNEELTNALATIHNLATHDSLTGLPNRASLNDTFEHALARAVRGRSQLAIFFLDLDHFKSVNDTMGHPAGDQLLREMARRLRRSIRGSDLVARLGGDEFVVMAEGIPDRANLQVLSAKLLATVGEPIMLQGHEVKVTASIGLAVFPDDGRDVTTLLASADMAMYRSKALGRNRASEYSAELGQGVTERFEVEKGMRLGMENNEFHLYYQPKVEFRSGKMLGVEALIRWHHPVLGVLGPDRFIRIAEETNFILPLGRWVIEQACRQARAWHDARMPRFAIAVNLSAKQLTDKELVNYVRDALRNSGADPSLIEIEITETAVIHNLDEAVVVLEALRALGVRLSIDDFGTGYSSLSFLKQLPVDTLKVDRSFVKDLPHNPDDMAITRAVIAMAHGLSMKVVAEGVEERRQFDFLRDEGCDEFQGFFCRPALEHDKLEALIREHGLVIPAEI